ncbi:uncharacterized protein LOC120124050 [Hibiscus syriacus]|uniref:uncharacterized protein LOC120124050 n=1 Tax=Hibiscus syriacus TaxID=106335 RepID=UPI00192217EF|nr:uncharacterized protein LOC120124050 [Hibiscus syriacus]
MQKTGTIEVPEQAAEVKEETLPSWWLVNQAAEEKDSPQSARSHPPAAEKQNRGEGKPPCLVMVLSEHGKYTFRPNEPGILADKPAGSTGLLPFNQKLQEENIMGSSSEVKVDSKGLFGSSGLMLPRPKLELQMFDGSNPKGWKGSVEEYQEKFEELRPYLLQQHMHLGEDYFVSSFISGLKEELKHKVKVLEPRNLSEAYRQAKLYELANEMEGKKYKYSQKLFPYTSSGGQQNSGTKSLQPKTTLPNSNTRQSLLEYRRENNLCFKCGEKFAPGHQCKELTEGENGEGNDVAKEALEISINAITGNVGHTTLRIQGFIIENPLNVLIDSGSTHSFVTPRWAKEGVELVQTQPLVITVANEEKLFSNAKSNQVSWKMQGYEFQHDFRVLSLGGSDMVLGVDWIEEFSPIMMDFKAKTISFERDGKTVMIRGTQKLPTIKTISGEKLQKLVEKDTEEVFEEPKGMPPSRRHDHAIVLKHGTQPINLRPYRFAHHHKTEVEKQIAQMLASSIIQIDLRSGYWQIRIKEEDVHKTAFRTHQGHYEFKVMPFGLTNAPSTFQDLINDLFGAYLRSMIEHKNHLRVVLEILLKNSLYAKKSKCFFGQQQVEYLGHLISAKGVATDPEKIKAMQQWPLPKNLKALRGFLGLTGYYRKFIKGYGELSKPLTNMLKKEGFHWSPEAKLSFENLKRVMCEAPVLALPNFEQKFFLETDASSRGIGAVLSQAGRPIAYLSKALGPKHADLSIYEKEYLAILMAVSHWRHYLESGSFVIKTYHEPLKHLLEQKLTTTIQKKGLTKLLGLDYTIQYRKGKTNKVADALSRQRLDSGEFLQMGVTVVIPTWRQDIEQSYEGDLLAQEKIPILLIQPDKIEN